MNNHYPDGFPEAVVATILKEVIKGVEYLHENHMIHNDIRADNILIDAKGDIRLGGYRLLRTLQNGGTVKNAVFSMVGDNIEWAAPEVISQNASYTQSADIYSLGITAMELAFNRTPFDDWPPLKVISQLN
jgi:serine/threonine protein kinase